MHCLAQRIRSRARICAIEAIPPSAEEKATRQVRLHDPFQGRDYIFDCMWYKFA